MKILSIGLDNSVLNKNSSLAKRIVEYGNLVGKYTVIVPSKEDKEIVLSEQANAIGAGAGNNKIAALFKIYNRAKDLLIKEKYDIITVQDQYYLALVGLLLARKILPAGRQGKLGLEIQVHGFEKYHGLRKLIAKFVIPRANAVRVVSQRLKKQLISEFSVKEDKITVVPIYVNVRNLKFEIARLAARQGNLEKEKKDKFIFLTVGRLVSVKNIEMQIRAMVEVVKQYPNIELWIIGEGPEIRNLKFVIARLVARQGNLELEKNVKFFGWQDDLEKFYSQADVFLLTSNYEGWGLAVIEAASYGLPIIMTDVGCAGEIIKNSENGIVIPVGDQKKLEESMVKLIKNNELRKRLGENAQEAVKKLLSKEETLNLYKDSWQKAAGLIINK